MSVFPIQPSFSHGELTPRLRARVDIDQYKDGLAYCSNFFVLRQGGIRRRAGMRYINQARYDGKAVILRPFVFLVDETPQVYTIEFGDGYLRFHTKDGTVTNGDGSVYQISSPWPLFALRDLQFKQIGDTVRIAHRNVATQTLRRYGETDWRVLPIIFQDGPYQDIIADGTVLTPSSNGGIIQGVTSGTTAGLGTAFASSRFFGTFTDGSTGYPYPAWQAFDADGNTEWMAADTTQDDYVAQTESVGFTFETPKIVTGYVLGSSPREEQYVETDGSSSVIYKIPGSLRAPRSWVLEATNGDVSTGHYVTLDQQAAITGWGDGERRYFTFVNAAAYSTYRLRVVEVNSSESIVRPVSIGTLKFSTGGADIGLLRFTVSSVAKINAGAGFKAGDVGRHIRFLSEDAYWHWFRIIGFNSSVSVDAEMYSPPLPSTNGTVSFQLGAFGDVPGWPGRVGLYQDRVAYARTDDQPQTLWLSKVDDYDNFQTTIPAQDDDATNFTIAEQGQIQWILEASDLVFGTENAIRSFGAANANAGFSATNFKQGKPVRTGSFSAAPEFTGIAALFVGRLQNTLHELTYDFTVDSLVSPDIAVLSDHLLKPGIIEMAYAFQPNAVLWIVMADGTLVAMTYEREQKTVALTRHSVVGGAVESVCVVPGATRDEVWFSVRRGTTRTIELLEADFEDGDQKDAFYVDCGVTYSGAPVTVVTGLPQILRGRTVSILADGAPEKKAVVTAGGSVTLASGEAASTIQIGLGYQSLATTLRLSQGGRGSDGSGLGRKKILKKILVDVLETGDVTAQAADSNEPPQQMILRNFDDPQDEAVPLFTGTLEVRVADRWKNAGVVNLSVTDPLPCTILAISPSYESEP